MSIIYNKWYIPNCSDLKVVVELSFILKYQNPVTNDSDDQFHLHAGRVQVGEDQEVGPAGDAEAAEVGVVTDGAHTSW